MPRTMFVVTDVALDYVELIAAFSTRQAADEYATVLKGRLAGSDYVVQGLPMDPTAPHQWQLCALTTNGRSVEVEFASPTDADRPFLVKRPTAEHTHGRDLLNGEPLFIAERMAAGLQIGANDQSRRRT